eukprot:gene15448-15590_t
MPGIIETLGAMAGTDLGKAINLAHTTFQDRMGVHNHFGRALLETIAKVAREHPNLMGIGAALLVEAIILADKRHHELHPDGAAQPHAAGGGLPHVTLPHVSAPHVGLPHISAPHLDLPHLQAPSLHLDHIKPGKVAMEVFGGLILLKLASAGARMFRRRKSQDVWFAPASKIHLISGTLAAYYISKSIASPKVSAWRNAAAALFATDALKPVLKAPKRPKGAAATSALAVAVAAPVAASPVAAAPIAPTPTPPPPPAATPEPSPTEAPPSGPGPTLSATAPGDAPASVAAEARAALSSPAERMRAPPPPADAPAFWTPPPRPRDPPTGEIIQWTGFSGSESTGHLTP